MRIVIIFLLLCAITIYARAQSSDNWDIQTVSGSTLKFKNSKYFNTHVYQLKYIGQIPNGDKIPFFIFSGRDCNECDENISIYIHSPANGELNIANGANRYGHPGSEKDFENNNLVYKGRAFYGRVLKNTIGVIWYQNDLMDNHKWKKSIFLVKIANGTQKDTSLSIANQLVETLRLCEGGFCREIKGINYTTEP